MANFSIAFNALVSDVFCDEANQLELNQLPLKKLGYQASMAQEILDQDGWKKCSFNLMFREWYRATIWQSIRGSEIDNQGIAESIFRYASFTSCTHAIRLLQATLGMEPTGKMEDENIFYINTMEENLFYTHYSKRKARHIRKKFCIK